MRRFLLASLLLVGCSRHAKPDEPDEHSGSWRTASIGSVYESKTVTRLEKPFAHETETLTKQTLVARTDSEAAIQLEIAEGSTTSAQRIEVSLRPSEMPSGHDGSLVTKIADTCTVPAGTFQCTRTTVEVHQGDVTRSTVTWTANQIPVPVKSIVTNENMTITTELTRIAAR